MKNGIVMLVFCNSVLSSVFLCVDIIYNMLMT